MSTPNDPGTADPAAGSAVPPYEGRRESADVDGEEKLRRDGAAGEAPVGPAHRAGTGRGEAASRDPHEQGEGG